MIQVSSPVWEWSERKTGTAICLIILCQHQACISCKGAPDVSHGIDYSILQQQLHTTA